ncbi:MAG: OsmC family protein [Bryobacteraceae bacterium]
MGREHRYSITTAWTGNLGSGTSGYREYSRNHELSAAGKASAIPCSSDAAFRGDASRYNPEDLLVASLSACHMLWFLHLCADSGIAVTTYRDIAEGTMRENSDGSGEFVEVVLRPEVGLADSLRASDLDALHERAHSLCFIARSVRFPVRVQASLI